ncbi:MAG: type II toxin-antitoxin system RelE/ParE family toxin [Bacteroidales bacterium]|jgi:mRNA-degrading endonuclease RelE of RelBE toxin-antitoxin system|nr:type II toxin-antitoxin system RelE/ParE family toxin [Bacteroidales bacterium]
MSYSVELTPNFKKEAKRLSKKYPSLKMELEELFTILEENPASGISLGNNIYKIRLQVASKNKGKSGGARVLYFLKVMQATVLLFSIYSKGEVDNITDGEIRELIKDYL